MKRFLFSTLMVVCLAVIGVFAANPSYDMFLVDGSSIVADTSYVQDLKSGIQVDYLSFQAIYSSEAAKTAVSFYDGTPSTGIITSVTGITRGSTITVNGIGFTEGREWTADPLKSSGTATALYTALASSFTGVINFSLTTTESVIYATAAIVGINYTFATTTATAISVAGMTGGVASDINYVSNTISKSNSFITGLGVIFSTTIGHGGYMGLDSGTTYYTIATASTIKLATTKTNAIAGTAIDISSITAKIGWANYTLTPSLTSGGGNDSFAFKWQVSNDNRNWYDLNIASVTISKSTAPSNYFWDFGMTSYRYIRCKLTSGTFGSIKLKLQGYGKRVAP
jgi:hypothetical protein